MLPGNLTGDIDLIQVLLVAFFAFFGGLVLYLRREDKREGYPLEPTTAGRAYPVVGFPSPPPPKTFRLIGGGTATMPHRIPQWPIEREAPPVMGGPLPGGVPSLGDGLGAGASVLASEAPMRTAAGDLLLQPLRDAPGWSVGRGEDDPRGSRIAGSDLRPAGTVVDIWVDRVARILRYLEVELDGGGVILVPIFQCDTGRRGQLIVVWALRSDQLAAVPRLSRPGVMTAREEDRLTAFYAGAEIYEAGIAG